MRVIELDESAAIDPTASALAQEERRTCTTVTPLDQDGNKLSSFVRPVDRLIEVRVPSRLKDDDGRESHSELGLRFTWVPDQKLWRLIQTCVYYPKDGGYRFAAPRAF